MEIDEELKEAGLRSEADLRNEKIGFKIREAQGQRIPYMLVIGDKEVENGTVSVRSRSKATWAPWRRRTSPGSFAKEIPDEKALKEAGKREKAVSRKILDAGRIAGMIVNKQKLFHFSPCGRRRPRSVGNAANVISDWASGWRMPSTLIF